MTRYIKKVAVLGSGVMGSNIACHLANAGFDVLLLDIVTPGLDKEKIKNGQYRNKLVDRALKNAINSKPAPLFKKSLADHITTGNFEDDLPKISSYDWILEVIIEDPDIKNMMFSEVQKFMKPGAIVTTNTSGIPIKMLSEKHGPAFRKNFFGTHFFNPPRYLDLLEIIPGPDTDQELIDFFMDFGRKFLGKQTVLCKDSPAFIANRIGVYSISRILDLTSQYSMDIETVDALTGPSIGRPKTGTFRLQDLIGVDTGMHVLQIVSENCQHDPYLAERSHKPIHPFIKFLLENKYFGNKSGQGFYKKTKDKDEYGKSIILSLDLQKLEYRKKIRPTLESLASAKKISKLKDRIRSFMEEGDAGNQFLQDYFLGLFAYTSIRIPEVSDQLYSIDAAMRGGYAWEIGPFEYWDMIGVPTVLEMAEKRGIVIGEWVREMLESGISSFYKVEDGKQYVYDISSKSYIPLPGSERSIILKNINDKILFKNSEASLYDIGEGVICLEFNSKNNVIGEGTGEAMHKALDMAVEEGWNGVVIGHNDANFTVGANLMLVAMHAYQKDWKKLDQLAKGFQDVNMRLRYAPVPVVTATSGYVFGGGIEMSMHADGVAASAESYIGLVEAGVGLIPGGGGTKEFALRLSDSMFEGDIVVPKLIDMFRTIAMAQVATSAAMAFDYKYLLPGRDSIVLKPGEHIHRARQMVLHLNERYLPPSSKKVRVLGQAGLATLKAAINEFKLGSYISDHDALIAEKTAFVMCGGELTQTQNVSEQYLLDLEREAFLSLCGTKKTLDRIQHMLQYNKPLRN